MTKFRSKKILLLIFSLIFYSCFDKIKDPVLPSWNIELNVPIANKIFTLEEIVKKQDQIKIEENSPDRILKFTSDVIEKDTTLDFLINNTFDMYGDTSFPVIGRNLEFQMLLERDSVRIDSAIIRSGIIRYKLDNRNSFPVNVSLVFPGLTKVAGLTIDTFKISGNVPANQQISFTVPMADYRYKQPNNQPFPDRTGIWINGIVSSSVIGIGQNLKVEVEAKDLKFSSLSGKMKSFSLGKISTISENALASDLKDFIKAVSFDSVSVNITTMASFKGFDVLLKNFQVIGRYKNSKPPVYLLINGKNHLDTIIPANRINKLTFNTTNTSINSFLSATPDSINISGELILNPFYKSGTVNTTDKVKFSLLINAWSKMKVTNAQLTDTLELDLSENDKSEINKANNASLTVEFNNEIPLSAEMVGYFLDRNYNKLFYFTRQIGDGSNRDTLINIAAANVNAQGNVIAGRNTKINFKLNQIDFEKFKNAKYIIQNLKLNSSNNQSVILSANNKVSIKLKGRINYNIKEN